VVHLVWDWNGTLLDDLTLVVAATNASLASAGGGPTTAEAHRREFCRPISLYYSRTLGRSVDDAEFAALDRVFHEAYASGLVSTPLAADALTVLDAWSGTQSLLSMWFHRDLVPTVARYGLTRYFTGVDGLRAEVGGGSKAPHLLAHLLALGLSGPECVLIGDSVDDSVAAASVGAGCVLYTGGFTDPDRLRATGRPVADTLAEAVAIAARQGDELHASVAVSPIF
jgi:phosphoglycolate phosphatase-like HAD superfamily hydrolase